MSIIISEKGGERRDFKPVPAGTHLAVCTMLIDIGLQPGFENGPPQRKVYIGFEVPAERVEFTDKNGDKTEGPSRIGRFYTASFNEKATLRHHLAAWRGRDFTSAELKGFDLFNILGKSCLINVTHKTSGERVYANITSIMALPKGTKGSDPEGAVITYPDESNPKALEMVPEWLQKKIIEQINPLPPPSAPAAAKKTGTDDLAEFNDEIPF
jgi:hypothetical protein